MPEIVDLFGRFNMLAKKYGDAIPFYVEYLKTFPSEAPTMYSLAKIYFSMGNTATCYEWLKKAIDAGFKCYWVLKYDPLFERERQTQGWKNIIANIKPKPFPEKIAGN